MVLTLIANPEKRVFIPKTSKVTPSYHDGRVQFTISKSAEFKPMLESIGLSQIGVDQYMASKEVSMDCD